MEALAEEGYETCCIGGVSFFDKRSGLGNVFPGYFKQSFWNPAFSPIAPDYAYFETNIRGAENVCAFAEKWLEKLEHDKKIFLYLNVSAIHYPNYYYLEMETQKTEMKFQPDRGYEKDTLESHAAALRYVDRAIEPLFKAFEQKGDTFVICCSDHGTCYGEDGCVSHGLNHPMVTTIPYKHFLLYV